MKILIEVEGSVIETQSAIALCDAVVNRLRDVQIFEAVEALNFLLGELAPPFPTGVWPRFAQEYPDEAAGLKVQLQRFIDALDGNERDFIAERAAIGESL